MRRCCPRTESSACHSSIQPPRTIPSSARTAKRLGSFNDLGTCGKWVSVTKTISCKKGSALHSTFRNTRTGTRYFNLSPQAQIWRRRRSHKYCTHRGRPPPPSVTLDVILDHVVNNCLFGEIDLFALEVGLETPPNFLFLGCLPCCFVPSHLVADPIRIFHSNQDFYHISMSWPATKGICVIKKFCI